MESMMDWIALYWVDEEEGSVGSMPPSPKQQIQIQIQIQIVSES